MDIGRFAILVALVAAVISFLGYYMAARDENESGKRKGSKGPGFFLDLGRLGYYAMTAAFVVAGIYLYYLILNNQFHLKYVYQYTSKDLSFGLLLSTFWAGQEGSFLFWAILIAVSGFIFMKKAGVFEVKSMVFLNIVMGFFLVLLIKASPFALLGGFPPDGSGLNPLLQNFWMIIHPPILFIGYAAITFPFILAMAALWNKDYDGWLEKSLPWTVFSSLTLGAGIIIGAFWAYETLGWGGYWGWDPVENSSLIPWLTILALLHGLLVQRRTKALRKTNFVLAILSFVLVLYATFLTRSGVLEDFSVHSFQDLGLISYLLIFMLVVLGLGVALFVARSKDIPVQAVNLSNLNRENGLMGSLIVFSASAFLTFLGTSSPIITGFFGSPSQVATSFYDKVNLPVGILMALLLGIAPLLLWVEKDMKSLPRKLMVPIILAALATLVTMMFGTLEISEILFLLAGYFAFCTNTIVLIKNWKVNWRNIAGPLSHFGVGIVLVSIIIAGNFAADERVILELGQPLEVLGQKLTYQGIQARPDGKDVLKIQVEGAGESYTATPRLYLTKNSESMREPFVKPGIITDTYISPLERRAGGGHDHGSDQHLTLTKGESKVMDGYMVTFLRYHMTPHDDGASFQVGAVIKMEKDGAVYTATPLMIMEQSGGRRSQPAIINLKSEPKKTIHVSLLNVQADQKKVELSFAGLGENAPAPVQTEQLVVEFSKKPFMSLLWLGTVLLCIGTIIAFTQRIKTTA